MASLMDIYGSRYRPVTQGPRRKRLPLSKTTLEPEFDGRDMIRQAVALSDKDPRYQALISGAEGGPFAVGSVGNVAKGVASALKYVPFLRHSIPVARGTANVAKGLGRRAKKAVWQPGTKPKVNTAGEIVTAGTRGRVRPGAVATGLTVAELGALGVANKDTISGLLGGTPEEQVTTPEETVTPTTGSTDTIKLHEEFRGANIPESQPMIPNYSSVMDDNSPHRNARKGAETFSGDPMYETSPVGNLPAEVVPEQKPVNKIGETQKDTPSLWKTWGSLADDPKKRRDAYLGSIKNIFMKKMMLDSIANLTGGVSQGGSWAEMAIAELDAVEKFDSEQRLHNQWKALFFREDGTYDPPKNRKEAMERGQQLGYDSDQMKDIMTVFPKEKESTIELTKRYIDSLPEGSAEKRALQKKHLGMHEDEGKTTIQQKMEYYKSLGFTDEELAQSARYDAGIAPRPSSEKISKPTIQKKIEYLIEEFNISSEDAKKMALIDAGLMAKQGTDKAYSARGQMLDLYLKTNTGMNNKLRAGTPTFDVWLAKEENQRQYNALLSGIAIQPTSAASNASMVTGITAVNPVPE